MLSAILELQEPRFAEVAHGDDASCDDRASCDDHASCGGHASGGDGLRSDALCTDELCSDTEDCERAVSDEEPLGDEPYDFASVRAFSELCDVDGEDEIVPLEHVPPVMIHGDGRPYGPVLLRMYCATRPPPEGPLEAADEEDEDDLYDWYTFPRALEALGDDASRAALFTAAAALHAAAIAGKLPRKWAQCEGGVFGQELFSGGVRSLAFGAMPGATGISAAPDNGVTRTE